ncbi:hypothetical protein D7S89_16700 [Trinickia fusca]|uniref:Uncharacterized protein n=1 Tax=Trinickia fusca TaxID=2419777 RepID=A0A494XHF3_9BURK|nr:hypothetical protein D7S89_16700 [Trinickia fusca]
MSGGGGGSGDWRPEPKAPVLDPKRSGGGSGGGVVDDPCVIDEVTSLNSVSPAALRNVGPGTLLEVVFMAGPPQRLVAQDNTGQIVGSITSRSMLQFIECIQSGRRYVAEVLGIQGGSCQVRVRLA